MFIRDLLGRVPASCELVCRSKPHSETGWQRKTCRRLRLLRSPRPSVLIDTPLWSALISSRSACLWLVVQSRLVCSERHTRVLAFEVCVSEASVGVGHELGGEVQRQVLVDNAVVAGLLQELDSLVEPLQVLEGSFADMV